MTAAEIIRDALTQYAAQTVGHDKFLASEMATCADHLAAAHGLARNGFQAADIDRLGGMRHALERIGKINGSTGGSAALVREFKHLADLALNA